MLIQIETACERATDHNINIKGQIIRIVQECLAIQLTKTQVSKSTVLRHWVSFTLTVASIL